jgi:hypothetical protein
MMEKKKKNIEREMKEIIIIKTTKTIKIKIIIVTFFIFTT